MDDRTVKPPLADATAEAEQLLARLIIRIILRSREHKTTQPDNRGDGRVHA